MGTTAPISPNPRADKVDKARRQWIGKLIDLSRRNNLLYFRTLKNGTLDLTGAPPEFMAKLLSGDSVPLSKLVPADREFAAATVREIARRALSNAEEKGLQTLFVAVGMATWPAEDEGRPYEAPLLLVPVTVASHGRSAESFSLSRGGVVQVNLVLLHVLDSEYGIKVASEELIPLMLGDDEGEPFDPQPLFNEVINRVGDKIKGFEIRSTSILGNFAFQKMAMVKDLLERGAELAAHDLIAGMAGDTEARSSIGTANIEINPRDLDKVPPDNEFLVLDADSSQQSAIAAISNGSSAVVHGPPGTGKSQTIVNLIASLTAAGKRILFVAEKRAALEVVQRRLKDVGLDHLAIDLHGADVAPKRVMEQVARALETVRNSVPVDCASLHGRLTDRRTRLNAHDARMHQVRLPAEKTVYELQGLLLKLGRSVTAKTRWRGSDLAQLNSAAIDKVRDLLKEAAGFSRLFLRTDPSPWTGADLPDGASVQSALELVSRLNNNVIPDFSSALQIIARSTGVASLLSARILEIRKALQLIEETQATVSTYKENLYRSNPSLLAVQIARGVHGGFAFAWAYLSSSQFRTARLATIALRNGNKADLASMHQELTAAANQLSRWKLLNATDTPKLISDYVQIKTSITTFWNDFDELNTIVSRTLDQCTLDQFASLIRDLASDSKTPHILPKLIAIERDLVAKGLGNFVAELRTSQTPTESWLSMLDLAWYTSTLDAVFERDPELGGFHGQTHNGFVTEFVESDEDRIEMAASRVRRAHAERAIAAMNDHPDQQMTIRGEALKSRRHMPLRRLFAQASEVLTAVCPCWMASPLSVSQLLDGGKRYFDYVIFDEASQVLPEDAVCAILRGDRLVVAGDRNQLPPTAFFAAATDDELAAQEESDASDGYESLLDLMNGFLPSKYLDWHYRSKDEALIAFSNHFIYRDRLVTFPGPGGPPVISHVLVDQHPGMDGQEESCSGEVQRVVELVIDHARKRPHETLGVITMGIRHRDRVQFALDNALEAHPDLDEFFDQSRTERCFVKNLEAVQGDERDAILISVGYGKDRGGNLPFRFGPLLPEGGRRRLNVAVTRARRRLSLVSSFSHLDMDMARVRPGTGVELLRQYLEYAHSKGKLLDTSHLTNVPMNDFEQEIFDALTSRGLKLIPQLGASQFRIDLVAEHPNHPGRYVLAIECDGATYHSSNTARDRDRLRQHQLEALGWRFHRIWSTDWFMRKSEEVEGAIAAFDDAVRHADVLDSPSSNDNGHAHGDHDKLENLVSTPKPNGRTAKPFFVPSQPIMSYTERQLVDVVRWLSSDGLMRTDDELLKEAVTVLGFKRRGARIDERLLRALRVSREPGH